MWMSPPASRTMLFAVSAASVLMAMSPAGEVRFALLSRSVMVPAPVSRRKMPLPEPLAESTVTKSTVRLFAAVAWKKSSGVPSPTLAPSAKVTESPPLMVSDGAPSTSALNRIVSPPPVVVMLTALVERVTVSAAASLPNTIAPLDWKVSPSRTTFSAKFEAVPPSPKTVTFSVNVTSPAVAACTMPSRVSTVLLKTVAPAPARIAMAAPVPSPISVPPPLPTAALKVAPPVVSRIRSWLPSTSEWTVSAPVTSRVTSPAASVTWSTGAGATVPRVTAPAESSSMPLKVTLAFRKVLRFPAAMVTFSWKVTSPAASAWKMPESVSTVAVAPKVVVPVESIVMA